jgi:hypothetical protein
VRPRSSHDRAVHTSPTRLAQTTIELIIELRETLIGKGLDAGPHTIAWHLQHHHCLTVSVASISRHLHAAGLVTPTPAKRPKASYIRFAGANVIVVTHPAPIDRRHGISEELSTTALAMYWTKAGFETIKACPGLLGLSTIGDALANASQSLTMVPNLQLTFFKRDLDVFSVDP